MIDQSPYGVQLSSPQAVIRIATSNDAEAAAAVFEAAYLPLRSVYRPVGEVADRQAGREKEGTRLVALVRGQLVGTVEFDSHKECLHVIGLAVWPGFQRRGVARGMIDWIVTHAVASSRKLVVLETVKETGNVPVFEKLGFCVSQIEVTSRFASEEFATLHEVRMERVVG